MPGASWGVSHPDVVYAWTPHATTQRARRRIPREAVEAVLRHPEQRLQIWPGRQVLQSRVDFGARRYLIRVFVDVDRWPPEIVTVYRTSRIAKYWRES